MVNIFLRLFDRLYCWIPCARGLTKSWSHDRTVWNTLDHNNYDRQAHWPHRPNRTDSAITLYAVNCLYMRNASQKNRSKFN